jgi:hypothetical protein
LTKDGVKKKQEIIERVKKDQIRIYEKYSDKFQKDELIEVSEDEIIESEEIEEAKEYFRKTKKFYILKMLIRR